jgi:hypothetical protein
LTVFRFRKGGSMGPKEVSGLLQQALYLNAGKSYNPDFSVSEDSNGWWFYDNGRPITFIHKATMCFDPFEFSPFYTMGGNLSITRFYDMGSRIRMHLALLPNVYGNFILPDGGMKLSFPSKSGSRITLLLEFTFLNGISCRVLLRLTYSKKRGSYVYRMSKFLRFPSPGKPLEFCNFYAGNLGNGIPEGKKWSYTTWLGFDNKLYRFPHNPALTFGARKKGGITKNISARGFIGFGTEKDFNPVVLFRKTTTPLFSGTCDMWNDEHLSAGKPGCESNHGGVSETETEIEPVNIPEEYMKRIVAAAETIPLSEKEVDENPCIGIEWNRTCSTDRAVDPRTPWTGMVFVPGDERWITTGTAEENGSFTNAGKTDLPTGWVEKSGYSGGRSLRIKNNDEDTVCWGPAGYAFHIKPGKRYKFSSLVRTTGSCSAFIMISNAWRKFHDTSVMKESVCLKDERWKKVEVSMENDEYPFLYFKICIRGRGEAFFDNLFVGPA